MRERQRTQYPVWYALGALGREADAGLAGCEADAGLAGCEDAAGLVDLAGWAVGWADWICCPHRLYPGALPD